MLDGLRANGSNANNLRLTEVTYQDSGDYFAVVRNQHGAVTSRVAKVSVTRVVGWGENWSGELEPPADLQDTVAIAVGEMHCLALKTDATVIAWGANDYGQTDVPQDLQQVVSIAAGGRHSLALRADGTVVGWGWDGAGGLLVPDSLTNVTAIAAGLAHSVALLRDGTVRAWGYTVRTNENRTPARNAIFPLSRDHWSLIPSEATEVVAVSAGGSTTAALKADGTVVSWGGGEQPNYAPLDLKGVVSLAVGGSHSLALKADGTVVAWGNDRGGQCSVPPGLSNVVAISAGSSFSVALRKDGRVVAWGQNRSAQCDVPVGLANVVSISACGASTIALKDDGKPFVTMKPVAQKTCLGSTVRFSAAVHGLEPIDHTWLRDGRPLVDGGRILGSHTATLVISGVQFEDAGYYQLTSDNRLGKSYSTPVLLSVSGAVGWGDDQMYQAGVPKDTRGLVAAAAGDSHTIGLKLDGTVIAWGDDSLGQTSSVPSIANIKALAAGAWHNLALSESGAVLAWGYNGSGQCSVPTHLDSAVAVAAGGACSLALKADGSVVAWGRPFAGVTVSGAVEIAAGRGHNLVLRSDGVVKAYGRNGEGQCDVPPGLTRIIAVAAGGWHSLALRNDGRVFAWGCNRSGQCSVPDGLSDVVSISAGNYHSVALTSNGKVIAWGLNASGQCNMPPVSTPFGAIAAGRIHTVGLFVDTQTFEAATGLDWSWRTGDAPWTCRRTMNRNNNLSKVLTSGANLDGGDSWLEAVIKQPGTLRFWWKTESEANRDWLEVYVNGRLVDRLSGYETWRPATMSITQAQSTVRWRYAKDAQGSVGMDSGWIDSVSFTPVSAPFLSITATADQRMQIGFRTEVGFRYRLQSSGSLDASTLGWPPIAEYLGSGQDLSVVFPMLEELRFYRVTVE
jgi:alpha-tubulin suppressor-like RCC1 family protein